MKIIFDYFQEITDLNNGLLFFKHFKSENNWFNPVGKEFDYLRPEGIITYTIDPKNNVPLNEINFEGWLDTSVRLWSKSKVARSRFVLLERKPPSTPSFSLFSSIVDSGVDTAF